MIRVGVFGAGGRMGATVCRAVVDDPELELAAAVDPFHAGLDLRQVIGLDVPLQMAADGEAMVAAGVDVAVDFTQLDASRANLDWLADHGIHAVVGTSGFTPDDLDRFASVFTRSNCVIAPNFAIGAVLMMRFAEIAAPYFDTAEIIELHHDQKIDAPSGTAIATAQRMAKHRRSGPLTPPPTSRWPGHGERRVWPVSRSTRSGYEGWSPTRKCCSAPRARRSPSGTIRMTGRRSCQAWSWP